MVRSKRNRPDSNNICQLRQIEEVAAVVRAHGNRRGDFRSRAVATQGAIWASVAWV